MSEGNNANDFFSEDIETSLSYIRSCFTGIKIEQLKHEMKQTSKDEFLKGCHDNLYKIQKEVSDFYQLKIRQMDIETLEAKLKLFIKYKDRITLTEMEFEVIIELMEKCTSIGILRQLQQLKGYDLSKEIEENKIELKKCIIKCGLKNLMNDESIKEQYIFMFC
jgi:hypothetical protein